MMFLRHTERILGVPSELQFDRGRSGFNSESRMCELALSALFELRLHSADVCSLKWIRGFVQRNVAGLA